MVKANAQSAQARPLIRTAEFYARLEGLDDPIVGALICTFVPRDATSPPS